MVDLDSTLVPLSCGHGQRLREHFGPDPSQAHDEDEQPLAQTSQGLLAVFLEV